ncbi:hypothetical protein DCS_06920 [Drechmeria coniospora]|uniref:F-actin-capping protein subunit alpha n=1 Tax=Drechmeria coniospora TaxID=98403 RepID=A0A151GCY1_DRECN|nr:hypothetical protein DCS_06920 [Drechmeria coniospora]KYK54959.1 hypothetical protein DCS_06920 [Drechmeria coniospora]
MSEIETLSAFVEDAPPGELADVVADIKALTLSTPNVVSDLAPAFEKYNEEQFVTVKLPGSSQSVLISPHNSLGDGRYYDVESSSSFAVDHATQARRRKETMETFEVKRLTGRQKASAVQSHSIEGPQVELMHVSPAASLALRANAGHYGAYPIESDAKMAMIVVANRYSPNNFWNGRWRSLYTFDAASGSLEGTIKVDVHYYEDGNVRLLTKKPISTSVSSGTGAAIVKEISAMERKYQDEVNKSFVKLSEGTFRGLRRHLPVTRQKVEWDKVTSYRLGQDIGGGSSKR